MGILDWIRGAVLGAGQAQLEDLGVKEISTIAELDEVFAESDSRPVFLFKHSTTCPISASAFRRMTDYLQAADTGAPPVYVVKVIESRPVSNEIAARLGVRHESPQCILMAHRAVVWHASHGAITSTEMAKAGAAVAS